jgi:ferredoxin
VSGARRLSAASVPRLVEILAKRGVKIYGPAERRGRIEYSPIATAADLRLDAALPALPLKALFLPPTEALLRWHRHRGDVALMPVRPEPAPAVVLGARPCDAAALAVVDKVMGWDYRDEAWFARRDATTIVAVACESVAADCFCEAVGLGRASTKGADVLLTSCDGGYWAEACTGKGEALIGMAAEVFLPTENGARAASVESDEEASSRAAQVVEAVGSIAWDDMVWDRIARRCHGCGACAVVCPTCHCFDIVDEPDGLLGGTRRRNWDTCQAAGFTRHASGHNPRPDQRARFRQRVLHKFSIYPARFGDVLCTGCGRCAAACPAGQNLAEILAEMQELAAAAGGRTA